LNQGKKVFDMVFVPNHQTSKILEPREKTLNFPSPRVPAKLPSILGATLSPVLSVGRNQFNAALLKESPIKSITIVGLISNDPVWSVLGEASSMVASTRMTSWGEALSM